MTAKCKYMAMIGALVAATGTQAAVIEMNGTTTIGGGGDFAE